MNLLDLAHALLAPSSPQSPKIQQILSLPPVQRAINAPRAIIRTYDVPYLAGSSNQGGVTYIDRRVPKELSINGKDCDPAKYLNIHEQTEHALMQIGGFAYHDAHAIATEKEKEAVLDDGLDWNEYEKIMDGYVDETEHEDPENPPPDLYLKPYPHTKAAFLEHKAAQEPNMKPTIGALLQ